jgi:hypothetical protein
MDIFEKLAKLREKYPDEISRIEDDEKRIGELLKSQEYAANPMTQELLALCRRDILTARTMLATNRALTDDQRADAWHIIDARLWFVRLVVRDFAGELAQMNAELETELSR